MCGVDGEASGGVRRGARGFAGEFPLIYSASLRLAARSALTRSACKEASSKELRGLRGPFFDREDE